MKYFITNVLFLALGALLCPAYAAGYVFQMIALAFGSGQLKAIDHGGFFAAC